MANKPIIYTTNQEPQSLTGNKYNGIKIDDTAEKKNIPVVYGFNAVPGQRVYTTVDASDISKLVCVYALSEPDVDSLLHVEIDGSIVTWELEGTNITDSVQTITQGAYGGSVRFEFKKAGGVSSLVNTALGTLSSFDFDFAYIAVEYTYQENLYDNIPSVRAWMLGRTILPAGSPGGTAGYSVNPMDVIYDYLINSSYGMGIDTDSIDNTSFNAVRDYFAEGYFLGQSHRTYKLKPYTCNYILDTGESLINNLNELCSIYGVYITYSNGAYYASVEQPDQSSVYTFTESNILDSIEITPIDSANKANKIVVEYRDPIANFEYLSVQYPPDDGRVNTFQVADGLPYVHKIEAPMITNPYGAYTLALREFYKRRSNFEIKFRTTKQAFQIRVGDVCTFDITNLTRYASGFRYEDVVECQPDIATKTTDKIIITGMNILPDFTIEISARSYQEKAYPPYFDSTDPAYPDEYAYKFPEIDYNQSITIGSNRTSRLFDLDYPLGIYPPNFVITDNTITEQGTADQTVIVPGPGDPGGPGQPLPPASQETQFAINNASATNLTLIGAPDDVNVQWYVGQVTNTSIDKQYGTNRRLGSFSGGDGIRMITNIYVTYRGRSNQVSSNYGNARLGFVCTTSDTGGILRTGTLVGQNGSYVDNDFYRYRPETDRVFYTEKPADSTVFNPGESAFPFFKNEFPSRYWEMTHIGNGVYKSVNVLQFIPPESRADSTRDNYANVSEAGPDDGDITVHIFSVATQVMEYLGKFTIPNGLAPALSNIETGNTATQAAAYKAATERNLPS